MTVAARKLGSTTAWIRLTLLAATLLAGSATLCMAQLAGPDQDNPDAQAEQPVFQGTHRHKGDKDVEMPVNPITQGGTRESQIVAIVNGDVISQADVDARRRLFAMSTGLPMSSDVLTHLSGQVVRELVNEKLRLQEIQRRKIVVSDQEIADAINDIETRNRMPAGGLASRLAGIGIPERTLIDQVRVQIGWTRVLRDALGDAARVTPSDIAAQQGILKAESGQPEYNISEIFIPTDDPQHAKDAQNFADTVITQLHAGAPFSVVAAQFSQSQTALQGGEVGWRQANDLEPEVATVVTQMPIGAVSNPIPVAGGFMIVSLRAKRVVGNDMQTIVHMRQAFFPFTATLNPQAPTAQQQQQLAKAKQLGAAISSCDAMETAAKATGSDRPIDPGDVRLADVSPPAFQNLLANLPLGKASGPLVSADGIVVVAVCSREQKNVATETDQQIAERLVNQRADLVSRQLERDLRRRAVIDMRQMPAS